MDINFVLSLCVSLVSVTAFVVASAVLVNVTRSDLREFKTAVENRFAAVEARISGIETQLGTRITAVETRLSALENDVSVIRAICQERSGRRSPV